MYLFWNLPWTLHVSLLDPKAVWTSVYLILQVQVSSMKWGHNSQYRIDRFFERTSVSYINVVCVIYFN